MLVPVLSFSLLNKLPASAIQKHSITHIPGGTLYLTYCVAWGQFFWRYLKHHLQSHSSQDLPAFAPCFRVFMATFLFSAVHRASHTSPKCPSPSFLWSLNSSRGLSHGSMSKSSRCTETTGWVQTTLNQSSLKHVGRDASVLKYVQDTRWHSENGRVAQSQNLHDHESRKPVLVEMLLETKRGKRLLKMCFWLQSTSSIVEITYSGHFASTLFAGCLIVFCPQISWLCWQFGFNSLQMQTVSNVS